MSACSESRCALTETYSPTAIDIEPATRPATPAIKIAGFDAEAAATPIMRLAVDTIASSEPSTAARSHPERPLRCACPSCIGAGCVGPGFTSKPRTLISRVSVSLKKPDYGTPSQQLTRRVIFAQSCAGEHVIAEIRFILLCV